MKNKIRVKDKVQLLAGKDRGKVGTVKKLLKKENKAVIEQLNMSKKHVKGNPYSGKSGGIQDLENPVHYSNLAVICDACTKPTRIGYKFTEDGRKLRYCKKCNEMMD